MPVWTLKVSSFSPRDTVSSLSDGTSITIASTSGVSGAISGVGALGGSASVYAPNFTVGAPNAPSVTSSKEAIPSNSFEGESPPGLLGFLHGPLDFSRRVEGPAALKEVTV
ncbi:hypothetical protein K443DRAFT_11972 [Laccaria amethystina LaAM-08-1]|uniref:Uncharacterized protein n=1 Tax=Laccaria amethystina LaAM-08-1 TaxID=1095629 RepID=A0A0C9WSG9_9AGAR|nr:hypothetical protein K443DRAFT_11972 [Laccaria amethystina LaAM-08-1]